MRWLACPFLFLFVLAGCARVSVTTNLSSDGSFTRKIRYAVKKAGEGMTQTGTPTSIEDAFSLPTGANVSTSRRTEKDELIAEVTEKVSAGAPATKDVILVSEKKQRVVESSVTVRKTPDGKLEYTEHLHWVGPVPPNKMEVPPSVRAMVKKSLPEQYRQTEIIDGVQHDVLVSMVHAFFGPSEPMFFGLLFNTDAAERQLAGRVAPELIGRLKQRMPDLTDQQALSITRDIIGELKMKDFANEKASAVQPGANPDHKSDNSELIPLTFAVSFPGKIVESNGITDPLTGEVYWSLYPPTLQVSDVDLKVVASP